MPADQHLDFVDAAGGPGAPTYTVRGRLAGGGNGYLHFGPATLDLFRRLLLGTDGEPVLPQLVAADGRHATGTPPGPPGPVVEPPL